MEYRKKPVVIEAFKWTGGPDQIEDPLWMVDSLQKGFVEFVPEGIKVDTTEGYVIATPGDYIIKGVDGEFTICKPDIFEATYEPVIPPDPELVACPFCHKPDFVKAYYHDKHGYMVACAAEYGGCGGHGACCDTEAEAIKHWNSSAIPEYVDEPTDC